MIVSFFYMWSRIGHRAYRQRRGFYGFHALEFHEEGVRVTTKDTETNLKWSAFSKIMSSDRFIVLFVTPPANYIPLARSWCDTDDEWLRLCHFIRQHSPVV
jgi:YcxB-like protein